MEETTIRHISVEMCSACGEEHKDLPITRLIEPMDIDGVLYTHVTVCPSVKRDIYVLFL